MHLKFKPLPTVADLRLWSISFTYKRPRGGGNANRTFEIAAPTLQSAIDGFWGYLESLEGDDAFKEVTLWGVSHKGAVNLIVNEREGEING